MRKGLGQLRSNPLPVFPAPTRVNVAVASCLDRVRGLRSRQGNARCGVRQGENLGLREGAALSVLSLFQSDNQGRHRDNHDVWIMVSGHPMSMADRGRMPPVMSLESGHLTHYFAAGAARHPHPEYYEILHPAQRACSVSAVPAGLAWRGALAIRDAGRGHLARQSGACARSGGGQRSRRHMRPR